MEGISSVPYKVVTALVKDPEFITSIQSITNFIFITTYNSNYICNIGPFNQVNISKLYSSYGFSNPPYYTYYYDVPIEDVTLPIEMKVSMVMLGMVALRSTLLNITLPNITLNIYKTVNVYFTNQTTTLT